MKTMIKGIAILLLAGLASLAPAQSTAPASPADHPSPTVVSPSPPTGPNPVQSTNAPAGAAQPDPRVRALLDSAQLKYKINAQSGDFELIVPLKEHRSQLVVISSATVKVGNLELRRIWSPAAHADRPPSAELANSLLRDNFLKKLGYWAMLDSGNTYTLCFMAEVAPQAPLEPFLTTVAVVAGIADAKEKELTGKDVL